MKKYLPPEKILHRYNDKKGNGEKDQKWAKITKIIVPTEDDKRQLLAALEYLHNADIDTNYMMVNNLVHHYLYPNVIVVNPKARKPKDAHKERDTRNEIR